MKLLSIIGLLFIVACQAKPDCKDLYENRVGELIEGKAAIPLGGEATIEGGITAAFAMLEEGVQKIFVVVGPYGRKQVAKTLELNPTLSIKEEHQCTFEGLDYDLLVIDAVNSPE